jgi:hypothetical protein
MRNLFVLTKREQRVVIVIVMLLVAAGFAKHYLDVRTEPPLATSPSNIPSAPPSHSPGEEEQTNDE